MLKTNNYFVTKIKLPITLFQIEIMNSILSSFSKRKGFRRSVFALIFEKSLVKKRESVNNILKTLILQKADSLKNETDCTADCRIVDLSQYAKGA